MAVEMKFLNNRTRYAEFFMDDDSTEISKLPNIDRAGQDNLSTVSGIAQGSKAMLTNSATTYYRLKGDGTWVKIIDEGGGGGGSDVTKEYVDEQLSYKVDKQNGKSLSTNDFTNTYRLKLDGIEEGAEVNVIAGITLNGSPLIPSNKIVALNTITKSVNDLENYYLKTETYTKSEVDALVNAISTLTLDVVDELPTEDISTTTIYLIKVEGSDNVYQQYVYINNAWAQLGTTEVDLSNYYTKTQIDALLLAKQDVLIFDDIPTVSSNNPVKSGGIYNALAAKQDTLTFDNVPTSGSNNPVKSGGIYSALEGKQDTLTFDNAPTHGSDNVVTSGAIADAIANAETPIATENTAGAVKPDGSTITVDQDGTIHAVGGGGTQVQSDWNQTDDTAVDYIKNKPDMFNVIEQVWTMPEPSEEYQWKTYLYMGQPGASGFEYAHLYRCMKYSSSPSVYAWSDVTGSNWIQPDWNQTDGVKPDYIKNKPTIPEEIQYDVLPAASAELVGKVCQYTGTTSGSLTHNYFYECVADTSTTPATYSWVQTSVQSGGGSVDIATPERNGISKPDDVTIFINSGGTLRTKVWAGTIAKYLVIKDSIPNDTTIIITDSDDIPSDPYIVNGVKIVPWATGSWADISAMIAGHDAGKINLYDYWSIGDERTIHVNAIAANPNGAFVNAMEAQDVQYVLMNEGYMGQNVHYVVGQKNCLNQYARVNATNTNQGSWSSSLIRSDLNSAYYNALETGFKGLLKSFDVTTAETYNGSTVQVTSDKVALFAEKEIAGEDYILIPESYYSNSTEFAALTQIEYYKTQENRIKYDTNGNKTHWWERSPAQHSVSAWCRVFSTSGAPYFQLSSYQYGVAPFVCI